MTLHLCIVATHTIYGVKTFIENFVQSKNNSSALHLLVLLFVTNGIFDVHNAAHEGPRCDHDAGREKPLAASGYDAADARRPPGVPILKSFMLISA